MNLELLNQALDVNKGIVNTLFGTTINIESLSLNDQIKAMEYFMDGELHLTIYEIPKSTEEINVHFRLKKGHLDMPVGYLALPSLRKATKKSSSNGWASVLKWAVEDALKPRPSEKLSLGNKSATLFAIKNFHNKENITLIKKASAPLPEKYNTLNKIFDSLPLEKYKPFTVE